MRGFNWREFAIVFVEAVAIMFLLAVLTIGLPLVWGLP